MLSTTYSLRRLTIHLRVYIITRENIKNIIDNFEDILIAWYNKQTILNNKCLVSEL